MLQMVVLFGPVLNRGKVFKDLKVIKDFRDDGGEKDGSGV